MVWSWLSKLAPLQLGAYRNLGQRGMLGMNERNNRYIAEYNPRYLYPLVDNKLSTKKLALEYGINVPALIGTIENQHDAVNLLDIVKNQTGFCIKPAKGSGGKGIVVIVKQQHGQFYKANGQVFGADDLERHISNILAGLFSLAGKSDLVVIEDLVTVDPCLQAFTYEGVPDLRVILFRGFPVMCMMRLSCRASGGKANLHQGAVGVGIDMASGRAIGAIQDGAPISVHPDTLQPLNTLLVPRWAEMLELACGCYDMTGLGYLGVDLVLDKNHGPLLLELNARPGLSIQMANNAGLVPRLRQVAKLTKTDRYSPAERADYSRQQFGDPRPWLLQ